ncbi:YhcH/YjgK/YiaL family protein [Enterococcus faecalis]|uniref:YhcH/YjgK/YiaL family protein n=1 Tax=Enterococcus faecalis TaxID=1351 RepID=UPI001D17C59F|nr:YhcH/YjgK/YiaL family protein [Enterococcus faecalis]MCC4085369.1 YhcH/YjgK/YiaL family protein [Enterococcus faecalis]
MIITERSDFRKYASINPYFSKVCDFLENTDLKNLEDGKIDIDGDNVFANCMTYVADGIQGQQFETHKKYLDIHLVILNTEAMAVSSLSNSKLKVEFDAQKDIGFYDSNEYQMVILTESNLLVTFEEDLHQPKVRINDYPVKKLVIKVLS